MSDKTKNLRVGLPEVNLKNEAKYLPAKLKERDSNQMGQGHDFNEKGKSTNTANSSYHDPMPGSGAGGNFAEKDASAAYLRERGQKGQSIAHFSGNARHSREHTGNIGQTIYPSSPIDQVYKRATDSNDTPDPSEKKYK